MESQIYIRLHQIRVPDYLPLPFKGKFTTKVFLYGVSVRPLKKDAHNFKKTSNWFPAQSFDVENSSRQDFPIGKLSIGNPYKGKPYRRGL